MSVATTVTNQLVSAPLPTIVEQLGVAIARAQGELDRTSIALAAEMADTSVTIGDDDYNLISLGFIPSFFAFTEATVEAKLSFSMQEEKETKIGGEVEVNYGVVAASVSASYARKFSVSSEGSSSLAARLVSVPAPAILQQLLDREFRKPVLNPEP